MGSLQIGSREFPTSTVMNVRFNPILAAAESDLNPVNSSGTIHYHEINLAKVSQEEFISGLRQLDEAAGFCLCLVDEIDAKPEGSWQMRLPPAPIR